MPAADIVIKGAREHNLRNVDVVLPRNKLICLTGVSGSGKSSLVNDILREALARDLNEAIQVASKIPPARVGCVEVRPIRPIRETVAAKAKQSTHV